MGGVESRGDDKSGKTKGRQTVLYVGVRGRDVEMWETDRFISRSRSGTYSLPRRG